MNLSHYPTILVYLLTFIATSHATLSDDEDQDTANAEFDVRQEKIIQNTQGLRGNFFRTSSQDDIRKFKKFDLARINADLRLNDNCESEEVPESNPSRSQSPPLTEERLDVTPRSHGATKENSSLRLKDTNRMIAAVSVTLASLAFIYFQLRDWEWR